MKEDEELLAAMLLKPSPLLDGTCGCSLEAGDALALGMAGEKWACWEPFL